MSSPETVKFNMAKHNRPYQHTKGIEPNMGKKKLKITSLTQLNVDTNAKRVISRESERREFKLKYEDNNLPKFAKTMAAFANRDGGALFFGIKDRPREVVGVNDNEIPDEVVFTNFLKEFFQPEILFESQILNKGGSKLLCLIVSPASRKPVICKKAKSIVTEQGTPHKKILREGAIYYRYSSSTDEIKYGDLVVMLDQEREQFFKSMVDNITLLNEVGIDKAAVVNAHELSESDQAASVYLTNDTAENLNWIHSGRFVEDENDGGKAYCVVRQVEIKHGVEVQTTTDYAETHPMTKTALSKAVRISGAGFDAVTWKLGIKDNPKYHHPSKHGKNNVHKFTHKAEEKILAAYPVNMDRRVDKIKKITEEYKSVLRK